MTGAGMVRWRPPVLDVVLAVLVGAVLVFGAWGESHAARPDEMVPAGHVAPTWAYGLVVVASLVLAWRRRFAVWVWVVSTGVVAVYTACGWEAGAALLAPMIALYRVAAEGTVRRALLAGGATLVVLGGVGLLADPFGPLGGAVVVVPFEVAVSVSLGIAVANRRAFVAEMAARAERAERERDEEAQRQVAVERLRIARDLHDVVAHTMATISVQAAAAAHLLVDRPERAAEPVAAIRSASKDGLRELRAILSVLRAADEADPTQPAPGLAALEALVEGIRRAGLPTTVRVADGLPELPAAVDLAAYRIVQESLTNAVRHAGPATATVSVRLDGDRLRVEVSDTGTSAGAGSAGGSGHGLVGMRERAGAVGGTLDAGPADGGGFRVLALLPVGGGA